MAAQDNDTRNTVSGMYIQERVLALRQRLLQEKYGIEHQTQSTR